MKKHRTWKRKIHLINKPLQFSYMGLTIWILLLGIILVGPLSYNITVTTILAHTEAAGNAPLDAYQLIKEINHILLRTIGVLLASLIVFAGALEVIYMHRVAGPIHRMENVIKELSHGRRVALIQLRKRDFFKNMAKSMNDLIEFHNERDEKVQAILKEAKKLPELKEKVAEVEPLFPDSSQES